MTKVNVATLKAKLSQYLEMAQAGEEVVVTSHHEEIAKLIPFNKVVPPLVDWAEFTKENPPIKTKTRSRLSAAQLIRQIRDKE